jgi:hypothetical protein
MAPLESTASVPPSTSSVLSKVVGTAAAEGTIK